MSLTMIFLQATSSFTSNVNYQAAMNAAQILVTKSTPTCVTVAFFMLAISVFWTITQVIVFQKGWDLMPPLQIVAFIFFILFYNELASSIIYTADYISTKLMAKDVLASLEKISGGDLAKKHEMSLLTIKIPFDNFSSFILWIANMIQQGASMFIRILISKLQQMLVAFIYIAGIYAAMLSTIPGFGSSFGHWLKNLISVICWSLTLAILDNFMVLFLQSYELTNGGVASDSTQMIELIVLNLAIVIMYISVPMLTSIYIGHVAVGQAMSKLSGAVGGAVGGAMGAASKPFTDKAASMYKGGVSSAYKGIKERFGKDKGNSAKI